MGKLPPFLRRPPTGLFIIFGAGALGGAAFRYNNKSSNLDTPPIHRTEFTPFTLVSRERVSSTNSIFTLRNANAVDYNGVLDRVWKSSTWSVQVKQPQLQVAREYTPLPPPAGEDEEEYRDGKKFRFLIRKERGGEVSNYLHRLPEQSSIELRGPEVSYQIPDDVKEVVFLAGGTGIAPAMQVAHALQQKSGVRMRILWANRKREECEGGVSDNSMAPAPSRWSGWRSLFGLQQSVAAQDSTPASPSLGLVVKELEILKQLMNKSHGSSLSIGYYVDEEETIIKPGNVSKFLDSSEATSGSRVVLVSGPEGFIRYWAGAKVWSDGREQQGPLGGALSKLNLRDWKVYKL